MPRIEITIFDDDGKPIAKLAGTMDEATSLNQVKAATDPVAALAKRNKLYTKPAPHMSGATLRLHDDAVDWCNARSDCAQLQQSLRMLHDLWWLWYGMEELDTDRLSQQLKHCMLIARTSYAEFLANCFEGHGIKGRDGRYTVKRYLQSFKRGGLKPSNFDAKMDAARERLEMLRKGVLK